MLSIEFRTKKSIDAWVSLTRVELSALYRIQHSATFYLKHFSYNVYFWQRRAQNWTSYQYNIILETYQSLEPPPTRGFTLERVDVGAPWLFCREFNSKGALTFQSAAHGFQHFSYLVSATNVVDSMFVTIFLVPDLHLWFVSDMYKTKMTAALPHKFYVNFCFFKFDLNFNEAVHFAQSRHLSMKFLFKSRRNSIIFFFNSKKFLFVLKINWRHCLRHIRNQRRSVSRNLS